MKLTRHGPNSFNIEGLTLGKLIAIDKALAEHAHRSSVGEDVLTLLEHAGVTDDFVNPDNVRVTQ